VTVNDRPFKANASGVQSSLQTSHGCRRALCVYPYRVELGKDQHFPALGIEIIGTLLEAHADVVDVVDLRREAARTSDFIRPDTDLVCFSINWDLEVNFVASEIASVPSQLLTILGGRHVSEDPEVWLRRFSNVDIVVRGDGEETIEEIASGVPLEEVAGISFRRNDEVVHNRSRHPGPLRDDIIPNRRLRRAKWTLALWGLPSNLSFDTISSSRGCPFNCRFCSFSRNPWGTKRSWSARSPESVVEEIAGIEAKAIAFTDDNFTYDMDRVEKICDLLIQRGIRKKYAVNTRVEIAKRPDVLEKMREAGFFMLLMGIESAQDKTLRSMNKGFDKAKIREHFRVLRRSGMLLHGYFLVGAIGETEEEMREIGPFARELGICTMTLCILRSERHSGLAELVAESPGYHIAPDGCVYSDRHSVAGLEEICDEIYRSFYSPRTLLRVLRIGFSTGIFGVRTVFDVPRLLIRRPWLGINYYGRVGIGDEIQATGC
jgi:hypothetical protein